MANVRSRVAIGCGAAFIVACIPVGFALTKGDDLINVPDRQFRDAVTAFNARGYRSDEDAQEFAREISEISNLRPAFMEVHGGQVEFGVNMAPTLWDNLFNPGTRKYRSIVIMDTTGSFSRRWKAGLYKQFGLLGKSGDPTAWDFRVTFGGVVIKVRETPVRTRNVLDYLDFHLAPAKL